LSLLKRHVMQTALWKSKSKNDLKLLLELAKKIGIDVRQLSAGGAEDIAMVNAIKKGRTGEKIDMKKYLKKLRGE
jgi:hypothetical protein